MNINDKTGLPELPRGYYWRVKMGYVGPGSATLYSVKVPLLEIRERFFLFRFTAMRRQISEATAYHYVLRYPDEVTAEDIAHTASAMIGEFEADLAAEVRRIEAKKRAKKKSPLFGNYPPKSIKDSSDN